MMKRATIVLLFLAAFAAALFSGSGNVFSDGGSSYCLPGSDEVVMKRCFRGPDDYVISVDDSPTDQNPTGAWPNIVQTVDNNGNPTGFDAYYYYTVTGSSDVLEIDILLTVCDGVTIDSTTATEIDSPYQWLAQRVANGTKLYKVTIPTCSYSESGRPIPCENNFPFILKTHSKPGTGIECNDFMRVSDVVDWDPVTWGYIRGPGCPTAFQNNSKQFKASTGQVIEVIYDECSMLAKSVTDVTDSSNPMPWTRVPVPFICSPDLSNCQPSQRFGGVGGTLVELAPILPMTTGDIYLVIGTTWYTSCQTYQKYYGSSSSCPGT